jgi:hypothetical protein
MPGSTGNTTPAEIPNSPATPTSPNSITPAVPTTPNPNNPSPTTPPPPKTNTSYNNAPQGLLMSSCSGSCNHVDDSQVYEQQYSSHKP